MISTIPPPRPVSVNSLARASATIPFKSQSQSHRCTSAEYQPHDDLAPPLPPPSAPGQLACQSPIDTDMDEALAAVPGSDPERRFENLPIEIHEAVLDYLFGERTAALTTAGPGRPSARSWNQSMRHPRRKALSNLSLITPIWRSLVQERIYRHSMLDYLSVLSIV